MIPVVIDIADVASEFALAREEIDSLKENIVKSLTADLYEQWLLQAGKKLKTSRSQYQNGLVVIEEGRFKGGVTLVGVLPNMIESGVSAFDMKIGFSKSQKVKRGKNGQWYLTIPFRLGTPGANAERFAGVVPTAVYEVVKSQPSSTSKSGIKRSKGLAFNQIPAQYQAPKVRKSVSSGTARFDSYKNKNSIYEGLTKVSDGRGGSRIMGFRRVSKNSDPSSWIHTGIQARNLGDAALNAMQVDVRVDKIVDDFLSER